MGKSPSESEGEIFESESEKATSALPSVRGTAIDRKARKHDSPSASYETTPERFRSRSPVLSNPRSPRGDKRRREVGKDRHRPSQDSRRFRVRYEDDRSAAGYSRNRVSYADIDDTTATNTGDRDDGRGSYGHKDKKRRTRSRSPDRNGRAQPSQRNRRDHRERQDYHDHLSRNGENSKSRSMSKSGEQEVPKRPKVMNEMKVHFQPTVEQVDELQQTESAELPPADYPLLEEPLDETAEIERRRALRKKRLSNLQAQTSTPSTPNGLDTNSSSTPLLEHASTANGLLAKSEGKQLDSSSQPIPTQPGSHSNDEVLSETLQPVLVKEPHRHSSEESDKDEPLAADYDPTVDRQQEALRNEKRHKDELRSADAPKLLSDDVKQVLIPASKQDFVPEPDPASKADVDMFVDGDGEDDMFAPVLERRPAAVATSRKTPSTSQEVDMFVDSDEGDDMFAPAGTRASAKKSNENAGLPQSAKGLEVDLLDNWDDPDGYYRIILGELIDGRYTVQSSLGRGVFSGVIRAVDSNSQKVVAIKVVRNNETMKKAGLKEIQILQELADADRDDRKHMIRLERTFEHKNHLCMVFENLSMNLREVIKKYGRDNGINLKAVRSYAQQMFLGLSLLRKCGIVHADLKPDNILVDESRSSLKICDLGSAMHLSDIPENEPTPYLVSRYYRAPEIILGGTPDYAVDMWSIGTTLWELYTSRILFTGAHNNSMLRSIMECRGRFPQKLLRKAQTSLQASSGMVDFPFDYTLDNFKSVEHERLTNREIVKWVSLAKFPNREDRKDLQSRLMRSAKNLGASEKLELNDFYDLLDKCLQLNPEKRISPQDALKHPFIVKRQKVKA